MSAGLALFDRRRTIRRVRPDALPEELIGRLVDAACAAPSAHNAQPWRFVLARTAEARRRLATKMAEAFRADLSADGCPQDEVEQRVAASVTRLVDAPLLVLVCLVSGDLQGYPDSKRQCAEWIMGIQSVAAAVENLLLAAAELDLGAGWMCAPLFCPEVVRQALDLPTGWDPQALVTVGWPAESPPTPTRRPRAELVMER
jgi:coenzyme F420-0:L-glutamate ligase / coenzyme F420-1:gamma-L-glutamate ligase